MHKKEEPLLPGIQVNIPDKTDSSCLISNEKILGLYDEVVDNLRDDRKEANEMYRNFADLVANSDASSASKEALVNLLKIKTETNDRMIKILDLWTRMKMKDRDTFPLHLAVQQNNKIESPRSSRKALEVMMKQVVKEDEVNIEK